MTDDPRCDSCGTPLTRAPGGWWVDSKLAADCPANEEDGHPVGGNPR